MKDLIESNDSINKTLAHCPEFAQLGDSPPVARGCLVCLSAAIWGTPRHKNTAPHGADFTERRTGEMLVEMEKHPGGLSPDDTTPPAKLEELGISRMQSHRWQLEASVMEGAFDRNFNTTTPLSDERALLTLPVVYLVPELRPEEGRHDLHDRDCEKRPLHNVSQKQFFAAAYVIGPPVKLPNFTIDCGPGQYEISILRSCVIATLCLVQNTKTETEQSEM